MKVCVAEKPSVAREIASILGATIPRDGYLEGNGYQVTWVFGHLCELKEPHEYNPQWKRWELFYLPMIPQRFSIRLKNDTGVEKQFKTIANLIAGADEVINCGDAGQEGELIQRWVYHLAKCKCPVKRLWISSLTEDAIREGFNNLKDQCEYDNLYKAGSLRAIGDWLLGMNATRAFTCKFGHNRSVLSIGRVQTPTLALVVARHLEIANFVPEQYWELKTVYRNVSFNSTKGKFTKKEDGEVFLSAIADNDFSVTDVTVKNGEEKPPRLFDLTSLQVECNKKLGLSADDTLKIIQSLYEKKVATYPRVDTTYLPDDLHPKIPAILSGLKNYAAETAPVLAKPIPKTKYVFDNSKITDHHAIIPTGVQPGVLTNLEQQVFDTVVRRFIANFYPNCKFATTTVQGKVDYTNSESKQDTVDFKTTGKQILEEGWRALYAKEKAVADDEKNEDDKILPQFTVAESGPHLPSLAEKWTTPPKPYTEATLLRAMETAGKFVDNEELRDALKQNGIGRPSTRASIIETLYKRQYMRKVGKKNIEATQTGIDLIATINVELLKSAELTGLWEKKLREVERGSFDSQLFMNDLKDMVADVIAKVKESPNIRISTEQIQTGTTEQTKKKKTKTEKKPDAFKKAEVKESKPIAPANKIDDAVSTTASLVCPLCGAPVLRGKAAYGCSKWKTGCGFRLPFVVMNHALTESEVAELLEGRSVAVEGKNLGLVNGVICEV